MCLWSIIAITWLCGLMLWYPVNASEFPSSSNIVASLPREFVANGTVEGIQPEAGIIVIRHGAISNYMAAMTMPFRVRRQTDLAGLNTGDEIRFKLHVTDSESWVDQFVKTRTSSLVVENKSGPPAVAPTADLPGNPLLDYKFTNELGQAVSLNEFRGQALAVTFFYTRCPLPDFCPRLSKNFQEASQKIEAMTNAPANWHLLSISFDTEFDSPATLRAYGGGYQYDPAHWSFLTGPPDKIAELARECGVRYQSDNGTINHNFRTLIIDATGHLQMIFPTGGNLSDQIVTEIIKAAVATNQAVARTQ